jgi:hypothetical protein
MLVIILFLGAVTFSDNHLTSDITAAGTNRAVDSKGSATYSIQADNGFVNYDWKLETAGHIGQYSTPDQGFEFVVATLYLQNYSNNILVAPNPGSWILVADNVTYSVDYVDTYDNSMGYSDMPIPCGGDVETKVVYQVPRNAKYGYVKHNGPFASEPTFIHINHYGNHPSA